MTPVLILCACTEKGRVPAATMEARNARQRAPLPLLSAMTHPPAAKLFVTETRLPPDPWWVVCLCAAWCNTCGDYRTTFETVAREWPAMRFEWVDIEDEAEVTGEVDVETFPTLLVADASGVRFLGPLLPQAGVLTRLLGSLHAAASGSRAVGGAEAQALFERVCAARR